MLRSKIWDEFSKLTVPEFIGKSLCCPGVCSVGSCSVWPRQFGWSLYVGFRHGLLLCSAAATTATSVYQSAAKLSADSPTGLCVQGSQPVTWWQDNYRWFFSIRRGQRLVLIKINLLDTDYFSPQCFQCVCKSHVLWQPKCFIVMLSWGIHRRKI